MESGERFLDQLVELGRTHLAAFGTDLGDGLSQGGCALALLVFLKETEIRQADDGGGRLAKLFHHVLGPSILDLVEYALDLGAQLG